MYAESKNQGLEICSVSKPLNIIQTHGNPEKVEQSVPPRVPPTHDETNDRDLN